MGPVSNSDITYGDNNVGCGTTHYHSSTYNITPAPEPDKAKSQVLEWISQLELLDKHEDSRGRCLEGVGNWLLEKSQFSGWVEGSADPTLFCYGDPGAGKTCISSLVIEHLYTLVEKRNFRVLYLYCDHGTYKERSAKDLIAGLLKNFVAGLDGTPEEVSREFKKSKIHGGPQRSPHPTDILKMLCAALTPFERTFICIDALDEFPQGQRPELLDSLAKLIRHSPKIRLFLTGRPHIRPEIEHRLGKSAETISIRASEEDIERYIVHRLGQDPHPYEMKKELENEIKETLQQKVSGIFLLVHLIMNAILGAVNMEERRERLQGIKDSPELQDEYNKTLGRIGEQSSKEQELAHKVLMWLCYSKRPLHPDELCHALAVDKRSTSFNHGKVSSFRTLIACCLGLVAVNKEASTIYLIHSTLEDYLQGRPKPFQGTNLTIAETCLTYLNMEDIKSLPPSLCNAPAEAPFLKYASCYWGEHAQEETTDDVEVLAKKFLGLCDKHISAKLLLLEKSWPWGCDPKSPPNRFSGLHCAAFFGLQKIAISLLDTEVSNLSQRDITGSTPLAWAARNGHEGLVQELLERVGTPPAKIVDSDGCTPFLWAARNGHSGVVNVFLQKGGINLETKDSFGRTPLSWASGGGHQEVVKLLLGRHEIIPEIILETEDCYGRTPLSWASGGGQRDVVELLLKSGKFDPNSADSEGRTPISWAVEGGHKEVVDLFLRERSVRLDLRDHKRRTLLSRAAESGNCSVVKLLLDQTGNSLDETGTTPLSWAASKGNEAVVKLFMEKGETRANLVGKDGSKSLWWAAGCGHAGVVTLLLGREGVNPDFVGEYGQTPLVRAAMHGHEQVVKLLLESGRVNRNLADSFGRTPLSWAAGSWRSKVVELLLLSGDIKTELADKNGQTPLLWAARNGDERVVQLLLEKSANPNSRDTSGRTPVSWAAGNGRKAVTKLLLSNSDIEPGAEDSTGRTPLSWASRNGRGEVVRLLMRHPGVDPNPADRYG